MLILVEPYAHHTHGHNLDKLLIWRDGLLRKGVPAVLVCYQTPSSEARQGFNEILTVAPWQRGIIDRIPSVKYRMRAIEIAVYHRAFACAKRTGWPVFGLYCCTPVSVAAAAALAGTPPRHVWWGQIVMDAGFEGKPCHRSVAWRLRSKARKALRFLLQHNVRLLCNNPRTERLLKEIFPSAGNQVFFVADPQPPIQERWTCRRTRPRRVLICGADDWRRDNLGHAAALRDSGVNWVLHLVQENAVKQKLADRDVEYISEFYVGLSLLRFFHSMDALLLAYRNNFLPASANLIAAVFAGRPVLCSRFPFAEEMFLRYGRLGEMFEFGDMVALNKAWERLCAWDSDQWNEFESARRTIMHDFNVDVILEQAVFGSIMKKGDPSETHDRTAKGDASCLFITAN